MEQCKAFIPGFITVNSPMNGDFYRHKIRINYSDNHYDIELRELSDGQKKLFVLYSLLINVPGGTALIIDEPENYLSPAELQPWLDAVYDAWQERGIQFILITHNPKTLNRYHEEAILLKISGELPRITAEKNNGNTAISLYDRLTETEWDKGAFVYL